MFITFRTTLDDESRHPLSRSCSCLVFVERGPSTRDEHEPRSNARALRTGAGFHCEDEGRKGEGRILAMLGISNRRFQISDLLFEICNLRSRRAWPRPESLCPEESLSEAS